MFVGTSPAFDLAMFSTCFIRGLAAPFDANGQRVTNCDCHIDVGGKRYKVEITTVERSTNAGKVITAYPTKVECKISLTIVTSLFKDFNLKH